MNSSVTANDNKPVWTQQMKILWGIYISFIVISLPLTWYFWRKRSSIVRVKRPGQGLFNKSGLHMCDNCHYQNHPTDDPYHQYPQRFQGNAGYTGGRGLYQRIFRPRESPPQTNRTQARAQARNQRRDNTRHGTTIVDPPRRRYDDAQNQRHEDTGNQRHNNVRDQRDRNSGRYTTPRNHERRRNAHATRADDISVELYSNSSGTTSSSGTKTSPPRRGREQQRIAPTGPRIERTSPTPEPQANMNYYFYSNTLSGNAIDHVLDSWNSGTDLFQNGYYGHFARLFPVLPRRDDPGHFVTEFPPLNPEEIASMKRDRAITFRMFRASSLMLRLLGLTLLDATSGELTAENQTQELALYMVNDIQLTHGLINRMLQSQHDFGLYELARSFILFTSLKCNQGLSGFHRDVLEPIIRRQWLPLLPEYEIQEISGFLSDSGFDQENYEAVIRDQPRIVPIRSTQPPFAFKRLATLEAHKLFIVIRVSFDAGGLRGGEKFNRNGSILGGTVIPGHGRPKVTDVHTDDDSLVFQHDNHTHEISCESEIYAAVSPMRIRPILTCWTRKNNGQREESEDENVLNEAEWLIHRRDEQGAFWLQFNVDEEDLLCDD